MLHKIQRVTEDGVLQVEEDRDKDMQCQWVKTTEIHEFAKEQEKATL
jgi:hypothetical protein